MFEPDIFWGGLSFDPKLEMFWFLFLIFLVSQKRDFTCVLGVRCRFSSSSCPVPDTRERFGLRHILYPGRKEGKVAGERARTRKGYRPKSPKGKR